MTFPAPGHAESALRKHGLEVVERLGERKHPIVGRFLLYLTDKGFYAARLDTRRDAVDVFPVTVNDPSKWRP